MSGNAADEIDELDDSASSKSKKAPNAFRTISEVADELHIPQHVLRFWETRFPQVKPLKRGGGRRYYRPDDITLLRRISDLLYNQGYTIKGVQRLLRESGGKLADNIPPPSPEEREAADAAVESPQLSMPGLTLAPPPAKAAKPVKRPPGVEDELARLRAVLTATLRELEALRALLP
jgi:DNA-binding transcriptional MerR regulator